MSATDVWIFRGDKSRRRRGSDVDILWKTSRADAAAATWIVRRGGESPRLRRVHSVETGPACRWRRDECLKFCDQLNGRDVKVRSVPGVRGKQDWQSTPANAPNDALPSSR